MTEDLPRASPVAGASSNSSNCPFASAWWLVGAAAQPSWLPTSVEKVANAMKRIWFWILRRAIKLGLPGQAPNYVIKGGGQTRAEVAKATRSDAFRVDHTRRISCYAPFFGA